MQVESTIVPAAMARLFVSARTHCGLLAKSPYHLSDQPVIGKRKHHRQRVMSEINVTPMVDVMLVLLIIFMVSAPLLTVGVPIDLPQSQAKSLEQDKEPLTVSVTEKGQIFLQNSEIAAADLIPKMQAVAGARGGTVLFGRGAGINEQEKIFGVSIEPEKEVVLTLVPHALVDAVLDEIVRAAELNQTGRGIAFVLPVDRVVGVAHFMAHKR